MDASERKNTWISLEDEFWEIEARWQWLYRKVKSQMENNHENESISEEPEVSEILTDLVLRDNIQDKTINSESREHADDVKRNLVCRLQNFPALLTPFCHYCKDVYDAVRRTTSTMSTVKDVMWNIWDNDTICESFYDAIQFSQQLLENLSTCWSIAFSLFRSQELDLLYRSEKLATQSAAAHQVSLKFIMSCWQTYLAAYPHTMTVQLNQARTKVKENGHSVGHAFSKPIVSSHGFTVAIARALQEITTKNLQLSLSKANVDKISRFVLHTNESELVFKDDNLKTSTPKLDKKDLKMQAKMENPEIQDQALKRKNKDKISPTKERLIKESHPNTKQPEKEKLLGVVVVHDDSSVDLNQPRIDMPKSPLPVSDKEDGKRVIFTGVNCQEETGELEKNHRKRIFSGTRYPVRCEVNSLYKPTDQRDPASQSLPSKTAANHGAAKEMGQQQRKRKVQKKHHEDEESGSICSRCKCCYEAEKHHEIESMSSSPSSPSTTSTSLSSTDDNDRDELSMASNDVGVTSGSQPEFKVQEWEAFLVDVMDLKKEWETLSTNLSTDNFDQKFKNETSENIEEVKTLETEEYSKSNDNITLEMEKTDSFHLILKDLIHSMNEALTLSALEIRSHIKHWNEREKKNELKLHLKGYDPNEAILQAKSFLFQLMQSFFSMLLLTAADNDRRVLCYASLLPESVAESRKYAYNLMLSREMPNQKRAGNEGKKNKKPDKKYTTLPPHPPRSSTVSPNSSEPLSNSSNGIVNPHHLCHHLAMALCKAHYLSGKFISLVSKVNE